MKLFRNLLIATAAVAVFAGVSAFAEGETSDTATYTDFAVDTTNVATSVVGVTAEESAKFLSAMGDQVTVVVVPAGSTEITDANIYYINQDANGNATTMLASMGTKTLTEGESYEVWVGGSNGTIKKSTFTYAVATPAYKTGDTNNDTIVDISDVLAVLNHYLGVSQLQDAAFTAGDVAPVGAADGTIDISDVLAVLNHYLGVSQLQ